MLIANCYIRFIRLKKGNHKMSNPALIKKIKELTYLSQNMGDVVSKGKASNEYRSEWRAVNAELDAAQALALKTCAYPMKPYGCDPFGSTGHMDNHPGDM